MGVHLEEHRLDNGLRVVLHSQPGLPLVAVNLWYHVGSKNERPGRTGLAHLFEHMLFQGSANVRDTDHFRYLQQVGGVANGSTWYDRTNYYETLPAHQLELGLWLESDRMGFLLPALTPAKLENQRDVVTNERRERVDNQPYGRAHERLHELLFPAGHPYRWPVIGALEDIAAATEDDVRDFFSTWYTPDNAVLTLAGDIEPGQALTAVEKYFGEIPPSSRSRPPVVAPDPTFFEERRDTHADDVRLARIYFGFLLPAYGHPDWYAADVLATLLTRGKSSRMYGDLVHGRELARSVSGAVIPTELCSTFTLVATANLAVAAAELEAAVFDHLDQMATKGPTDEDLERAKNLIITDLATDLETLDDRADLLSQNATYFGDPSRAFREAEFYAAVDAAAVRDVARRRLVEAGRAVVTVVPRERAA